jgi:hypothetical protein
MRPAVRRGGIALSAITFMMWTGASASANDRDALDVITELVPSVLGESAEIAADAVVDTGAVEVLVPTDAADGIELGAPGLEDLVIELPFAEDAQLSYSGERPFFDNGNGSSTVPLVKDDGAVQILTTIEHAGAPTDYKYEFDLADGDSLVLSADGGAEIRDADGLLHTTIDAPWALDANGDSVPTHYTVDGATLTQVVDLAATTAFPVVADPTISFGWAIYVRYSKSDVRTVTTGLGGAINDKAKFGFILCGKIPHWAAKAGCALLGTSLHSSIYNTFKYAKDHNQCVEVQLAYISYLPVVWKSYSC